MSVPKGKRKESSVEFDNTYFKIYEDAIKIIHNNFSSNKQNLNEYTYYIQIMAKDVLHTINEIGTNIRISNSIYPVCKSEYECRRLYQDKAIGLCFDLLTKYQLIMRTLETKDEKYVVEIQNVIHEINCLKKWRKSDTQRYKNLG